MRVCSMSDEQRKAKKPAESSDKAKCTFFGCNGRLAVFLQWGVRHCSVMLWGELGLKCAVRNGCDKHRSYEDCGSGSLVAMAASLHL